jgi:hypothetical protein
MDDLRADRHTEPCGATSESTSSIPSTWSPAGAAGCSDLERAFDCMESLRLGITRLTPVWRRAGSYTKGIEGEM